MVGSNIHYSYSEKINVSLIIFLFVFVLSLMNLCQNQINMSAKFTKNNVEILRVFHKQCSRYWLWKTPRKDSVYIEK